MGLGLIDEPLHILNTETAVFIGIVYAYLPFMVLPLYAALEKMDDTLIEAALDLGSPPWRAFWSITVPLSHARHRCRLPACASSRRSASSSSPTCSAAPRR